MSHENETEVDLPTGEILTVSYVFYPPVRGCSPMCYDGPTPDEPAYCEVERAMYQGEDVLEALTDEEFEYVTAECERNEERFCEAH